MATAVRPEECVLCHSDRLASVITPAGHELLTCGMCGTRFWRPVES